MSKYLAAFYNDTDEKILFVNTEDSDNNQTVEPGSMFTAKPLFNIPDVSNPAQYFTAHHMEVKRASNNEVLFSFWDADVREFSVKNIKKVLTKGGFSGQDLKKDFLIYCCPGIDWMASTKKMDGYNPSGNDIKVALVLSGASPHFEIESYYVNALV